MDEMKGWRNAAQRITSLGAAALAIACLALPPPAKDGTLLLRLTLSDGQNPIAGAKVIARADADQAAAVSDGFGSADLTLASSGVVELVVGLPGGESARAKAVLPSGQSVLKGVLVARPGE